jgi:hypothetical protein
MTLRPLCGARCANWVRTFTTHADIAACRCRSRRARLHSTPNASKIEAGDTNVGIGLYTGVLQALGLLDGLSQVADISNDRVGRALPARSCPSTQRRFCNSRIKLDHRRDYCNDVLKSAAARIASRFPVSATASKSLSAWTLSPRFCKA